MYFIWNEVQYMLTLKHTQHVDRPISVILGRSLRRTIRQMFATLNYHHVHTQNETSGSYMAIAGA